VQWTNAVIIIVWHLGLLRDYYLKSKIIQLNRVKLYKILTFLLLGSFLGWTTFNAEFGNASCYSENYTQWGIKTHHNFLVITSTILDRFCKVVWRRYLSEVGKFYRTSWQIYPRHRVSISTKIGQIL